MTPADQGLAALREAAAPYLTPAGQDLTPAGPGDVAITADPWINEQAQRVLTFGLPKLPAVRRFDPSQPRGPDGQWIGLDLPDVGNLFGGDAWGERFDNELDERSVAGFAAVALDNGETQVAFDRGNDRYVLFEGDSDTMRSFADFVASMHDDAQSMDGSEENDDNGLVDSLPWSDDASVSVGYDVAGDFRITHADGHGNEVAFPELSSQEVGQLVEALHEMAQAAQDEAEQTRSSQAPNMRRVRRILDALPDLQE